jgi:hypothetical protein
VFELIVQSLGDNRYVGRRRDEFRGVIANQVCFGDLGASVRALGRPARLRGDKIEIQFSDIGHLRPDTEVRCGGVGQIGRWTRSGYFSAIHAKVAAVPASFAGASEFLARSASRRTSVAGPAAKG